ncbi:YbaK/EbsC family protein [Geminocystis sp. NIES-3709]|uniref:YbaK/EbsC family protein n=1 Tax=Geminocystis sp. NIES-3709 TaxID=1617448 RepID=UPI0005FC5022|nr:YbaK/EbsC family protein [Geminocystis sp. NIES-3709]BAQ66953.1 putative cytoplasmic protein [Geminocystis sp. NIES-3709]
MTITVDLTQPTQATDKIIALFQNSDIDYKHIHHDECRTSEESQKARAEGGAGIVIGAKAILMKIDLKQTESQFWLFVLAGDKSIDSKSLKKSLKQKFSDFKKFRFSTAEEMAEVTNGLQPGTMPPFGKPIFADIAHLFIDRSLLNHDVVGFNAACLTQSLVIPTKDYIKVAHPTDFFDFCA